MTNREFFNAILTGTLTLNAGKETETSTPAYVEGVLIDELKEFATKAIEKLDAKNAAAKGKPRAKRANPENEALKALIVGYVEAGKTYTAKAIAEFLAGETGDEIAVQKASGLLRSLVAEGKVAEVETKKGKTKEYTAIDPAEAVAEGEDE
jgi:hypothetical protein